MQLLAHHARDLELALPTRDSELGGVESRGRILGGGRRMKQQRIFINGAKAGPEA